MDSTERFRSRVNSYDKYRPSYPQGVLERIISECGINSDSVIADIGAGTGIFTRLLLGSPAIVIAIEPNKAMRKCIQPVDRLVIRSGTAENTGLESHSVDLITAAQAFHWFDPSPTRAEFHRVLKEGGYVALVWNTRKTSEGFMREYDELLDEFNIDYRQVVHTRPEVEAVLESFADWKRYKFPNVQKLSLQGLIGRYLSSSYALPREHMDFPEKELKRLFDKWQSDGSLNFEYTTELLIGRIE